MTETVQTEILDGLPERSLAQVVTERHFGRPHYQYFEKFGTKWLELDPSDRFDGENTEDSGYLVNLATGFGRNEDGFVRILFVPGDDDDDSGWEA